MAKGWHQRDGIQTITNLGACDERGLDFTLPIAVESIPPESEVSCRNTLSLLRMLRQEGRDPLSEDLRRYKLDRGLAHYEDPHKWISYEESLRFFSLAQEKLDEPNGRIFFELGRRTHQWPNFGPGIDALANFLPLSRVMWLAADYARMFNNGQFLRSVRRSRGRITVISRYSQRVVPIRIMDQDWWALGIYSGFPQRRNLPQAEARLVYSVCSLERILDREYAWVGIRDHRIQTDHTFLGIERRRWIVEGNEHAHEVALLRESLAVGRAGAGEDLFHPVPHDLEQFDPSEFAELLNRRMACKVWLVTSTLRTGRGDVVREGELWGAPYSRYELVWQERSRLANLVDRLRNWRREIVVSQQAMHREITAARVEALHAEQEKLASERKSEVFRSYARRSLVDRIDRGEDPRTDRPRRREMAVLFCDMCDFTDHSSHLSPEDTVSLLNSYFNRMNRSLFQQRGEIEKIMGDGIMATFENLAGQERDVVRAAQAAVSMRWELQRHNRERRALHGAQPSRGIPFRRIDNGTGIAHGPVVTGNIGSDHKLDHTLIGDVVNVASRLERLTRHYGSAILVTEEVRDQLASRFQTRFLDVVRVRGRDQPLRLHEVFDHEPVRVRDLKEQAYERMAQAWALYAGGLFHEAEVLYAEIRRDLGPHRLDERLCLDPAVDFFLRRCQTLRRRSREEPQQMETWDGIHVFVER